MKRYTRMSGGKEFHAIIDWEKDGQLIKIYKTKKACDNNIWELNNNN